MAETALNFGPEWLRVLSHGNSAAAPTSPETPIPKYKLAQYRYGREEMLALFSKDLKIPEPIKELDYLLSEKCQQPLALQPITEEEQRLWARSVNSDVALRASGKGPSTSMIRGGRGGSVDRGRGRGRGGYYQRGINFDENDDGPPGGFSRLRTLERSQSMSDKDQRWDERDRRLDRTYSGRTGLLDDGPPKPDASRPSNDNWRRSDKEEEGGWRSSNNRDKFAGGRNPWRFNERSRTDFDGKDRGPNRDSVTNGPGNHLPEWSVEESVSVSDGVGSFDATGAFMETKPREKRANSDDVSPEEDEDNTAKKRDNSKSKPAVKVSVEPEKPTLKDPPKMDPAPDSKVAVKPSVEKEKLEKSPPPPPAETFSKSKPSEPQASLPSSKPKPAEPTERLREVATPMEEDNFAHHIEATENMVAQWTKEEEQNTVATTDSSKSALPLHHEDAHKWFYRDPQAEIQGPFPSSEMCDWFKAGYFSMDLLVRRGCDEKFTQLGDLMRIWGHMPFISSANPPPPIRAVSAPPAPMPVEQTPVTAPLQHQETQIRLMQQQQQMFQQLVQHQQLMMRQAQLQQLMMHLKQEDFAKMNLQQQVQAVQQFVSQQQQSQQQSQPPQVPSARTTMSSSKPQQPVTDNISNMMLPMMNLNLPPIVKNDVPLWNVPSTGGNWPLGRGPLAGSIWDAEAQPIEVSELEKKHKLEEEEKRRQAMEAVKRLEEEKKKREEEERKQKEESERLLKEIQRQQKEEQQRLEELRRLKEEEKRRKEEELKRIEEKRKEEERILQEMRKKEELRRLEEEKKRMELEEKKRKELLLEECRKKEELEQMRKHQLEMERLEEEAREEERQRALEMQEAELQRQLRLEAEKQQLLEMQQRREEQKLQELQRKEGPVWGVSNMNGPTSELPLSAIQKLQEKKERDDKERLKQLQLQQQILFQQQQSLKQAQGSKNGLSWAKRATECGNSVKSLAEIQQEEARLAQQQQQKVQKTAASAVQLTVASGAWGSAPTPQPNRLQTSSGWTSTSNSIWEDSLKNIHKPPAKSGDSAFPALNNSAKPASVNSNKNKNVRAKRDENAVLKLFETHRKPTDEFTTWCTEALSGMSDSFDVPTFVTFLKDVESPYEVYDYVRSYLGEGKEARDFGKQFLERRSKYRNQSKQEAAPEENMWGPAPAITPGAAKPVNSNDCDSSSTTKGKAKKKKNKMQKLDNSMLGFTVHSNPDRLNVGEIDRVDGM